MTLPGLVQTKRPASAAATGDGSLPAFTHSARAALGPRRLRLPTGEEFETGVATFAATEIAGAAGEWRVVPWWLPGWIPESADCGQTGNAVLAGHVSWYRRPGPFQYLGALVAGDAIACQSRSGDWYTYIVTEVVRVEYSDTGSVWWTGHDQKQLTLYTCTPAVDGIIMVRARIGDNHDAS